MGRPSRRLSNPELAVLRSHWVEQHKHEVLYGTKRSLQAGDVVAVIDELIMMRLQQAGADLLKEPPMSERAGLAKLIDACATKPTDNACCALHAVRNAGWTISCAVDDDGVVIVAKKPNQEGTR